MSYLSCEKRREETGNQTLAEYELCYHRKCGTLCSNRAQAKELIESLGGKVTGTVTGKTNYLINNDTTSNSSKNKKARELGIPILSEEDFI